MLYSHGASFTPIGSFGGLLNGDTVTKAMNVTHDLNRDHQTLG